MQKGLQSAIAKLQAVAIRDEQALTFHPGTKAQDLCFVLRQPLVRFNKISSPVTDQHRTPFEAGESTDAPCVGDVMRHRNGRDLRKVEVEGEIFFEPVGHPINSTVLECESDGVHIVDRIAGLTQDRRYGLEWYLATRRHSYTVQAFLRHMSDKLAIFDQGRTPVVADVDPEH